MNEKVILEHREELLDKDKIVLGDNSFAIINGAPIGKGSSCINYLVDYQSPTKGWKENSILKEFYPGGLCGSIFRVLDDNCNAFLGIRGSNAIYNDVLMKCYDNFISGFEHIQQLHNTDLNDHIVYIKDCFFKVESQNGKNEISYIKAYLVAYDDHCNSCDKMIHNTQTDLIDRIELFESLVTTVGKFNKNNYLISDLKPSNILYQHSKGILKLKVLDYDSIISLENITPDTPIPCSNPYAAPEYDKNRRKNRSKKCKENCVVDARANIYTLGVILIELLFPSEWENWNKFGLPIDVELADSPISFLDTDIKNEFYKFSEGFRQKLIQIWKKTIRNRETLRYSSIEDLENDVLILKEIYQNKGVHPEVMLNKAIKMAEKINADDFEEELFTSIKEVDNKN